MPGFALYALTLSVYIAEKVPVITNGWHVLQAASIYFSRVMC